MLTSPNIVHQHLVAHRWIMMLVASIIATSSCSGGGDPRNDVPRSSEVVPSSFLGSQKPVAAHPPTPNRNVLVAACSDGYISSSLLKSDSLRAGPVALQDGGVLATIERIKTAYGGSVPEPGPDRFRFFKMAISVTSGYSVIIDIDPGGSGNARLSRSGLSAREIRYEGCVNGEFTSWVGGILARGSLPLCVRGSVSYTVGGQARTSELLIPIGYPASCR